jgi:hypothetical protein
MVPATIFLGGRVAETAVRVEDMVATAPRETAGVAAWPDPTAYNRAKPRVLHATGDSWTRTLQGGPHTRDHHPRPASLQLPSLQPPEYRG